VEQPAQPGLFFIEGEPAVEAEPAIEAESATLPSSVSVSHDA
jgi:hypothetical protein